MIEITFTGKFTLNELLLFRTIPELKELALDLGIRIKGSPKKQVIVDNLEKYMLENPEKVVSDMFYYELKACLDVMEGNASLDYIEKSGLLFQLNRFGLIYSLVDNKTEETSLHFEEAMADKLRGLIPDEIARREKDGSLMAEKLAIGCANLYGFTETGYLIDLIPELENHLGHTLDEKTIIHLFKPILRAMRHGIKGKERPFISPFAAYNGFEVDERHIDFMIEPKVFDTATILDYGEMPYPNIKGKAADRLLDTLKKFGKPDVTPEHVIRDLWINKQSISEIGIPDISKYFSFKSLDNARVCIDLVIDFLNNTPLWRFNGNSSSEVASMSKPTARGKMPEIIMGPGMRAMGIDSVEQLEEMACRSGYSLFPGKPYKAEPKVGRNDPCPCGSGKKYKHCCGKS